MTIHSNGVAEYVCGGHQPEAVICLEPLCSGQHYFEIALSPPPPVSEVSDGNRPADADGNRPDEDANRTDDGNRTEDGNRPDDGNRRAGSSARGTRRAGPGSASSARGTPSDPPPVSEDGNRRAGPGSASSATDPPPVSEPVLFSKLVRELGVVTAAAAAAMCAAPAADAATQAALTERIQAGLLGITPPGVGATVRPAKWNASCPFSLPGLTESRWREASCLGLLIDMDRSTVHATLDGAACGSAPLLLARPLYAYALLAQNPSSAATLSRLPYSECALFICPLCSVYFVYI